MKNTLPKILITATFASLLSAPAMAGSERASYDSGVKPEENAGVISGMVVGGLAGGPPGFLIGAAVGGLLGHGFAASEEAEELRVDLYASQLELAMARDELVAQQKEIQLARAELDRIRNSAPLMPANLMNPATEFDNTMLSLHFRTGSSDIESHYQDQLESLARLAQQLPSATVEITGYADRNGNSDSNLALSRERTASVADYLGRNGIESTSITTVAYGESRPVASEQSFETDFFDRRVIVRLRDSSKSLVADNPGND